MQQLIKDNPHAYVTPISIFFPFPGTPLCDKAVDFGFDMPESLEEWAHVQNREIIFRCLPEDRLKLLAKIRFLSGYIDHKFMSECDNSALKKIFSRIYSKIANFRIKYRLYRFMPELTVWRLLQRMKDRAINVR
jgi:hypothetical protein